MEVLIPKLMGARRETLELFQHEAHHVTRRHDTISTQFLIVHVPTHLNEF